MKKLIWLALILFFHGNIFGQGKTIEGDTSYWHHWQQPVHEKSGLKDFLQSDDEFNFRFQNHGQIVEISKNGEQFSGVLANYAFREFGRKKIQKDTLYNHTVLSIEVVKAIYDLLQKLDLHSLPSEEDIEGWSRGFDGITYILEYADQSSFSYKTYWSPHSKPHLEEANLVLLFIKELRNIVNLEQNRRDFEDTWPRSGCYNSGGLTACMISNSISPGFLGSSKFPLGIKMSSHINHTGKNTLGINMAFAFQKSLSNGTILQSSIRKNRLFIRKKSYEDFGGYLFAFRNINFLETSINKSTSHILYYGTEIPKLKYASWKVGINIIESEANYTGLFLGISKWFPSLNINFNGLYSIFPNQVNFQAGLSKYFNLSRVGIIQGVFVNLYYEQFFDYKDVNLGLSLDL